MEVIFPIVIFLFVVITSLMKNMRTRGSGNDQDSSQGPKWKRMYDTWEDVVGRIEKELNPQPVPRSANDTSLEESEVMTRQASQLEESNSRTRETIPMLDEDSHSGMHVNSFEPMNESSHEVGLSRRDVVNGIIMSEVLGKPRAMKPYQYGKYRS